MIDAAKIIAKMEADRRDAAAPSRACRAGRGKREHPVHRPGRVRRVRELRVRGTDVAVRRETKWEAADVEHKIGACLRRATGGRGRHLGSFWERGARRGESKQA